MEIILAFVATLLALMLGFLSTKKLCPHRLKEKLFNIKSTTGKIGNDKSMAVASESPNLKKRLVEPEEQITHEETGKSMSKLEDSKSDHVPIANIQSTKTNKQLHDDISDLLINSQDLNSLTKTEDSTKPVKVKEFIRMLRENQLCDMTEEEQEQEKRVQQQQLQDIFKLMQSSQNQCGIDSFDDMEEQMKLYAIRK